MTEHISRARTVLLGGFLGAGKTSASLALADHLDRQGIRVGLITNDQSQGLVDTALATQGGFPVQEITGGCFCCRFDSLVAAADALSAEEIPDVFIAEAVGSCTDLRASVTLPLRRLHGERFVIAPLSILVDPARALRILSLRPGSRFSEKVQYVYRKQLEEAELLLLNKLDRHSQAELDELEASLRELNPKALILRLSARDGTGMEAWFEQVMGSETGQQPTMSLDYQSYAEGEALLGWLNASYRISATSLDGNALLRRLAEGLRESLAAASIEIAHLKVTLSPDGPFPDLGIVNLVQGEGQPEQRFKLAETLDRGLLIVNLRAEGDPQQLKAILACVLDAESLDCAPIHSEAFRPAPPKPTHRLAIP